MTQSQWLVGSWVLDADSQRLKRGCDELLLNPKEVGVLVHLLEQAPHVVTTDQLLTRTWPHVVVGDNALQQVIGRLRRALGDDSHHPAYIETLPKRGYRLIARVEAPALPTFGRANAAGLGPTTTVVVLPFVDSSQHGVDPYLADGLTFEIQSQLAKIADLRIVSRSAVLDLVRRGLNPIEVGRRLNADVVLEGNLRVSNDHLRLIAQLTRVSDEIQLWSETLEHELDDLFKAHTDLAVAIAQALQVRVEQQELKRLQQSPTTSMAAYRLVQRARQLGGGGQENPICIELLEQAIALDPNYADAHAWLSWNCKWAAQRGHHEYLVRARVYAERAIELDSNSGWALYSLASVHAFRHRAGKAIRELRRSLAVAPSGDRVLHDLSQLLALNGQLEEALVIAMRAMHANRNDANTCWHVTIPLLLLGDNGRTRALLQHAVQAFPTDAGRFRCHLGLMNVDMFDGELENARIGATNSYEREPRWLEAVLCTADVMLSLGEWQIVRQRLESWFQNAPDLRTLNSLYARAARTTYGYALYRLGHWDSGSRILVDSIAINRRRIEKGGDASYLFSELVAIHAVLGDDTRALEWLERAYDAGFRAYRVLEIDPMLESLRGDSRFERLTAQMQRDVARMAGNVERQGIIEGIDALMAEPVFAATAN